MAERRGGEVRTKEALDDYLAGVLADTPEERQLRLRDTGSVAVVEAGPVTVDPDD